MRARILFVALVSEVFFRGREGRLREKEAARGNLIFSLFSLRHFALRLSPLHGSSLRKPLANELQVF